MGFGEQTEDRDLPHYIVVGTEHPDGGTGYYAASRAGLKRVSRIFRDQQDAINAAEQHGRLYEQYLQNRKYDQGAEVRIRDKGPEPTGLYGKPHPTQPGRSDVLGRGMTMEDLMYNDPVPDLAEYIESIDHLSTVDPVLEDEEPEYRRVKTPAAEAEYFSAAGAAVALGMEAPYPLNLSEDQTVKIASALLTFNLLGFRVRLERIHD